MDSHDIEAYFQQHRRTLAVILLGVGIAAVSGVFVGIRQTAADTKPPEMEYPIDPPSRATDLPPAPKYGEIPKTGWLANEHWSFTLDKLPRADSEREPDVALTVDELVAVLADRSGRRAFDGAPPTVPHEIDQLSSASCMVCHGTDASMVIAGRRPAAISHPYYTSCTQCHVPADGLRRLTDEERLIVDSSFMGLETPGPGNRAYPGAPPTVPHPLFMRQNCMSCHGPTRPNAIRSSHPDRQNCLQCHAPDAGFDNRERFPNHPPIAEP
ncbi:MAG: hypothetical protein KDN05_00185 [Verrucomicrobiae bacterium]|nr:hypothetical protein [Verrucomicrobiae bacterium]